MRIDDIKTEMIHFIQKTFLEESFVLAGETPLLALGILDSIKMTEFVAFIEQRFNIILAPEDVSVNHFKNIDSIASFVFAKLH